MIICFTRGLFSQCWFYVLFYAVFLAFIFIRLNKPTSLLSTCKTFSSSSYTGNSALPLFPLDKQGPFCSMSRIHYGIIPQLSAFWLLCVMTAVLPDLFWKVRSWNTGGFHWRFPQPHPVLLHWPRQALWARATRILCFMFVKYVLIGTACLP